MTQYVIHVGPPKTASKFLQSHLFYLRHDLAANGIHYPDAWWTAPSHIFHFAIFHEVQRGEVDSLREKFARINEAGHRIVVLSCEGFAGLSREQLEILKSCIGVEDIRIVYYIRRWSGRILSEWQQDVRSGLFTTLPKFYGEFLQNRNRVEMSRWLRVMEQVFGRRNLMLISLDNLAEAGEHPFRHFARTILGWNEAFSLDASIIQANTSPGPYLTEAIRCLNYLDFQKVGRYRLNMRVKLLIHHHYKMIDMQPVEAAMMKSLDRLTVDDNAPQLQTAFDQTSAFADCFINPTKDGLIFRRLRVEHEYVSGDFLLHPGAAAVIQGLYDRLEELPLEHEELS